MPGAIRCRLASELLGQDPTAHLEDAAGSLSFEVTSANWRPLADQSWQVVLDTAMTNGTHANLQQGSWYYDHLEVAQRPFAVSCISVADAAFVTPGLIADGRVGFIVRCEPVGAMKLVIRGADTIPDVTDTIEIAGDGDRDGC